jgi:hypothetical protein
VELVRDPRRDLALDREHVGQLAVVRFRPQVLVRVGVDELRRDPHLVPRAAHRPLQDRGHVELRRDLPDRLRGALVLERRRAGDHANVADLGEGGQDVVRDPVGEVLVLGVVAQVLERQHGDGRLRDVASAAPEELGAADQDDRDERSDSHERERATPRRRDSRALRPCALASRRRGGFADAHRVERERRPQSLECVLAARREPQLRPLPQLAPHVLADPHLARVRRRRNPRRHVHAVAVEIAVLGRRHVADVDADPELARAQPFGLRHAREVRTQRVRRAHRLLRGRELGQCAVAQELHHPSAVGLDHRADDRLEATDHAQRFPFVRFGQRAVADQVREPHGREMV